MAGGFHDGGGSPRIASNRPFPWAQVALLGLLLLNESLCSMVLLPFVGLFVAHLLRISPDEAGYASGFLVGVFQLALMVSGRWWGNFSDTHGRKPALLLGVVLSAMAMIFFGLSPNIYVALLWRFVHGLTNGISAVAKSAMAEVAGPVDETKGFATISLAWGIGSLVGPAIGGFLYDPTSKPNLGLGKTPILHDYPALLPAMVIAVYSAGISVFAMLFLEESNPSNVPITIYSFAPVPIADFINWLFGGTMLEWDVLESEEEEEYGPTTPSHSTHVKQFGVLVGDVAKGDGVTRRSDLHSRHHQRNQSSHSTVTYCSPSTEDVTALPGASAARSNSIIKMMEEGTTRGDVGDSAKKRLITPSAQHHQGPSLQALCVPASQLVAKPVTNLPKKLTFFEAFVNPNTRAAILLYMCVAFGEIGFQETFPLWGVASIRSGGLGLTSTEVGSIVVLVSVPCIVSNIAYPKVASAIGTPNPLFGVCVLIWAASQIVLPFATSFTAAMGYQYVVLVVSVWQVSSAWAFSVSYALIARAAPPGNLGTMNGYSQSMGAFMRTICPMALGPVFAWSVGHPHVYPFNHHFAFIVSALPLFATVKLVRQFAKGRK